MGPHDIEAHTSEGVLCACGRLFPTVEAQEDHFQVMRAREELRKATEGET